jgi:hypothetical protein
MKLQSQDGQDLGYFALTNHHVVAHGALSAWPTGNPLRPSHDLVKRGLVTIESPSGADHERFKKAQAQAVEEMIASKTALEDLCRVFRAQPRLDKAESEKMFLQADPTDLSERSTRRLASALLTILTIQTPKSTNCPK